MSVPRQPDSAKQARTPRVEVYWHAVSYRSVAIYISLILTIFLAAFYLVRPESYSSITERLSRTFGSTPEGALAPMANQARFVNLDGKVEIKKANSVSWANADYRTTLDKGDLVRTGGDGAARITFVDGTTYTVKNDSFVTVEQNAIDNDRSTSVAVHITSGAVDLATGTWDSPRSKAEVSFANARASLQENSRAAVQSDAAGDQNQITVSSGAANMMVGNEQVEIGKWERVTFAKDGPVTKTTVLAPPDLSEPVNLQPLIEADPKHATVHFAWSPVQEAVSYDLRISSNAMFTRIVAEKNTTAVTADLTGLEPGDYFWSVTATDDKKRASTPSEPFRFTLVAQGKGEEMVLEIDSPEIHGSIVELTGRTDPGSALIINGETVADIQSDGRFRYFTQTLTRGSHELVIIGQNRRGGTAVKRVPIVIP